MKKVIAISLVIFGAVFLAGCSLRSASQTQRAAPAPAPQATPTAQTSNSQTADWKTYVDAKYNFELSYPQSGTPVATYDLGSGQVEIKNFDKIKISDAKFVKGVYYLGEYKKLVNGDFYVLIDIEETENNKTHCAFDIKNATTTIMNNIKIYRGTTQYVSMVGGTQFTLCLENPGKNIRIIVIDPDNTGKLANQILSTFKFKNDTTADWQTYRNEQYGFEMKYPSSLVIAFSDGGGEGEPSFKIIEFGKPRAVPTFQMQVHNLVSKDEFKQGTKTQINSLDVYFYDESWQDINSNINHIYSWTFVDPGYRHWYRLDLGTDRNEELVDQILSTFKFTR